MRIKYNKIMTHLFSSLSFKFNKWVPLKKPVIELVMYSDHRHLLCKWTEEEFDWLFISHQSWFLVKACQNGFNLVWFQVRWHPKHHGLSCKISRAMDVSGCFCQPKYRTMDMRKPLDMMIIMGIRGSISFIQGYMGWIRQGWDLDKTFLFSFLT